MTLRARDASRDMRHAINLCADELARQVKRHRDKRRKRREARRGGRAEARRRDAGAVRDRPRLTRPPDAPAQGGPPCYAEAAWASSTAR